VPWYGLSRALVSPGALAEPLFKLKRGRIYQPRSFGPTVGRSIKALVLGEVSGQTRGPPPYGLFVLNCGRFSPNFGNDDRVGGLWFGQSDIWRDCDNSGGFGGWRQPTPFYFWISSSWPSLGIFCPVEAHDWATWQPPIGPCHPLVQSSCHVTCLPTTYGTDATCLYGLPHGCMDCHVALPHWSTC
jgi:hypothetical protein